VFAGEKSETLYKALSVMANDMTTPTSSFQVFRKEVGGVVCTITKPAGLDPAAITSDMYLCSVDIEARHDGLIFSSLKADIETVGRNLSRRKVPEIVECTLSVNDVAPFEKSYRCEFTL
jgi:hypothetical protein